MSASYFECETKVTATCPKYLPYAQFLDMWLKDEGKRCNSQATLMLSKILRKEYIELTCELPPFREVVSAFFGFVDTYITEISSDAADNYLKFHENGDWEKAKQRFESHLRSCEKLSSEMQRCLRIATSDYGVRKSSRMAPRKDSDTIGKVGGTNPQLWENKDGRPRMRESANRSKRIGRDS